MFKFDFSQPRFTKMPPGQNETPRFSTATCEHVINPGALTSTYTGKRGGLTALPLPWQEVASSTFTSLNKNARHAKESTNIPPGHTGAFPVAIPPGRALHEEDAVHRHEEGRL